MGSWVPVRRFAPHRDPTQKRGTQPLLDLLTKGPGDGKRPIVVLDSVRADEKALTDFVLALHNQMVLLGPGGVRVLDGENKEAAKYGAGPGDRVIIVSTKPGKEWPW